VIGALFAMPRADVHLCLRPFTGDRVVFQLFSPRTPNLTEMRRHLFSLPGLFHPQHLAAAVQVEKTDPFLFH
jgi:hypothetical protein